MNHLTHPLHHHITLTERAIAGAFANNGLSVHLCGNVQGPHTLTFGLRLYDPTQRNLNKALGLSAAVEAAIADSPARIYMDRGVLLVETPSPMPTSVDGRRLRGQGLAVPLGMTSRQTVSGVDLIANPHLLLVGPTNRGKTTAARLLAYHLAKQNSPKQARFIVATFKPKDWQIFGNLAHTIAVITDPHESARMISWLVDLMHRRTQQSKEIPHLFVFLDDLLNLLGVAAVDDQLAQLASLGRGAGIHLIIGTQRLGEKGAAGSLVTGNVPARLVFGTADAQDAALFTGRGGSGAERLGRYPGDALLVTDGGTQRLAVGYIKDAHLQTLPQQLDSRRPWLERAVSASHSEVTHTGIPTGTRLQGSNSVLSPTTGPSTIPLMAARGGFAFNGTSEAPPRHPGTQPIKLPDKAPDAEARAYLRRLYEEIGSKNKVLLLAWGGVINESGKTPKSKRWLDEALNEG